MKKIFLLFLLLPACLTAQVISIQTARSMPVGATVTVRGVVTNGYELGKIRYLQDGTAGIAAFPGTGSVPGFETTVEVGDSIEVTGGLVYYYGLLEISPITAYTVIASGLPTAPKPITFAEIDATLESQLVSFECVVFAAGGSTFAGNAVYSVRDLSGATAQVYLRSGHPMAGDIVPGAPIRLTGVLSRYLDFQILPRNESDFTPATCFYFTDQPTQSNIQSNGFRLEWRTNFPAGARIHYGLTTDLGSTIALSGSAINRVYDFSGLTPGAVYWVQTEAEYNGQLIYSEIRPFATKSLSSGQIKVYFNHDIDPAFANGFSPEGQSTAEVLAETIARINGAEQTIDVAMYNNSRSDLTNALKEAHARGVRVRYVASLDASNSALNNTPPFPVVYGNIDAIMHDKFMVVDVELADKAWVMGGSMNWTTQNVFTDFNNTLFIQDQSLARAYTLEFEEMWGGSGMLPDESKSRFGAVKRDNTPHHFIIGETPVELWFSPSDRTTSRIVEPMYSTDEELLFALFSFTKNDMSDAMIDQHISGRLVRGIMENINDVGSEYNYLNNAGISCLAHSISGDLHHKYAVIDANATDPTVITGSHNWSFAAEALNDENTLILRDYRLASLYKAEFEKRRQELLVDAVSPKSADWMVFPNPATDVLTGIWPVGELILYDVLGTPVMRRSIDVAGRGQLDLSGLSAGFYLITLRTDYGVRSVSFQKFSVYQEGVTHPVGTDGVLLGAWAQVGEARRILDVGTGTGLIALMLAQRSQFAAQITGIDIHESSLACAARNAAASPWAARLEMRHISLQNLVVEQPGWFDLIVSNPPFFSGLTQSPDETRSLGRHTATLSLQELMTGAASMLAPNGRFCVVLPEKEGRMLVELGVLSGLYVTREVQVRTRPTKPLERLLLQFERDPGRLEREFWSIYGPNGGYSAEYSELTKAFYL